MDRRRVTLALVVALIALAPGCLSLRVAYVPDSLLTNGWSKDAAKSQSEPTSSSGGFVKTQTLAYQDLHPDSGYPALLIVETLRALTRPSEDKLREQVEQKMRDRETQNGVSVAAGSERGSRQLHNGATGFWFVFNGTKSGSNGPFTNDAQVKVFGEVFQCPTGGADVFTIGIAQVTSVSSVGGLPIATNPDYATWDQIVQDPNGSVEGRAGGAGLAHGVAC